MHHFHQGSLKGGRGEGVGLDGGGGPLSTQPRTRGIDGDGLGESTSQPRPPSTTSVPTARRALTSLVIAAMASARTPGRDGRAGRAAAGAAEASCRARSRVVPQWQASARSGTRRPQAGHVHV
jgi:hypothetical protein